MGNRCLRSTGKFAFDGPTRGKTHLIRLIKKPGTVQARFYFSYKVDGIAIDGKGNVFLPWRVFGMKARVSWPFSKTCLLEFFQSVFFSYLLRFLLSIGLCDARSKPIRIKPTPWVLLLLFVNRRSLFIQNPFFLFAQKRNIYFQNKGHPLQLTRPTALEFFGRFSDGWWFWPRHGIATARVSISEIQLVQLLRFGDYRSGHVSQRVDGTGWGSRLPGWPFGTNLVFRPLRIGHREIARFAVEGEKFTQQDCGHRKQLRPVRAASFAARRAALSAVQAEKENLQSLFRRNLHIPG